MPRQLCPLLSPPPASHWGSRAQPCVAASRGPSCPPARVPSPFSQWAQPHALRSLSSLWGVLLRILRWKRLNPVPTATPAQCPLPRRRPCKWGPHVRCGRMSRPGLPRTHREAAPAQAMPLEGAMRKPTGSRSLPPAWRPREAPSEGRVRLGHQMLPRGAGASGKWGGLGVGEEAWSGAAPAWQSYFGPSEVRPGLPSSHLQTQRHVPPWDLTEGSHLTEAALPLPVLLGFLLKLL